MSSIDLIFNPADWSAVIALSRPLPGPFTFTSTSLIPNFIAFSAACWAANCPANGVLLRLPLKPLVPALDQQIVSPFVSVIVTSVLLKVALIKAIPTDTLRRTFLRFAFATLKTPKWPCLVLTSQPVRPAPLSPGPPTRGSRSPKARLGRRYRRSLTPFLPATVFFGPLRVRALVRVRCPRTGNPRR